MILFLSKEYLDRNIIFFSKLATQFIPDFFVAEYYGLRNTILSVDCEVEMVLTALFENEHF
jgi:hypothetical protein